MIRTAKTYTEEELVRGCCENNRRFQEALYRRYFDTMLRMVRRYTTDEERCLDILNNGFLKVFRKINTFRFEGSLEGWIRKIVYHSISDYFKKESDYLRFIVLEETDRDTTQDGLDGLFYSDLLKIVDTLPQRSREVFSMYAIEGYAHREIAEQLGISEGTSKWHLSNAREQLKSLLENRMKRNYAG
jgi:RNA polymerase sigma-70 factor (ECF subfamily)